MNIEIPGHILGVHWGNPNRELDQFSFDAGRDVQDSDWRVVIQPHTIEVEIELPSREQLTMKIVAALREQKQRAYVEAAKTAAELDQKIEELLAISYDAPLEDEDDIPF